MKKLKIALLPIMLVASNATADIESNTSFSQEQHASISHNIKTQNSSSKQKITEAMKEAYDGDASAQYSLGLAYYFGQGTIGKNKSKSFYWHEKAANQGHNDSQFYVGKMYNEGDGVKKNTEKAVDWFTKSAENGNDNAQFMLGHIYVVGDGIEKNYEVAAYWFEKAAMQGNPSAQNNLGLMYEKGHGLEQNKNKAIAWYMEAAKNGSIKSKERLAKITNSNGATKTDNTNKESDTTKSKNENMDIIKNPDHPFWKTDDGQMILRTPGALDTFIRIIKKQELAGVRNDDPFWRTDKGKKILKTPGALEEYYDFKIKANEAQVQR